MKFSLNLVKKLRNVKLLLKEKLAHVECISFMMMLRCFEDTCDQLQIYYMMMNGNGLRITMRLDGVMRERWMEIVLF